MADLNISIHVRISPGLFRWGLAGLALCLMATELASESVTLTTYYPAPSGVYTQMITTGNTYLARDSGKVGVGTGAAAPLAYVTIKHPAGGWDDGLAFERPASTNRFQMVHDADGRLILGYNSATIGGLYSNGGLSMGSGYGATTPPANGLMVQGQVGLGVTSPGGGTATNVSLDVAGSIRTRTTGCSEVAYSEGTYCCGAGGGCTWSAGLSNYYATFIPGVYSERQSAGNINADGTLSAGTMYCCPCGGACP